MSPDSRIRLLSAEEHPTFREPTTALAEMTVRIHTRVVAVAFAHGLSWN